MPKQTPGDDKSVGTKEPSSSRGSLIFFIFAALRELFGEVIRSSRKGGTSKSAERYGDRSQVDLGYKVVALLMDSRGEYTLPLLLEMLHPPSAIALADALTDLVWKNQIEKIIRVESPQGGGIKDFGSFEEIPKQIYDWRTDQTLRVQPNNLVTIFRAKSSPVETRPDSVHEHLNARKRA